MHHAPKSLRQHAKQLEVIPRRQQCFRSWCPRDRTASRLDLQRGPMRGSSQDWSYKVLSETRRCSVQESSCQGGFARRGFYADRTSKDVSKPGVVCACYLEASAKDNGLCLL